MAMMDVNTPVFIDTNFLLRATISTLALHTDTLEALKRLMKHRTALWINRQVLREYMATVTRPQNFMDPLPSQVVVQRVRYFERRFKIAEESPVVTANLLNLLETVSIGGKQIHDANIVATMQVYQITQLLTFNTVDFVRFTPLISLYQAADVP
jgi:predicted nucleic acid-binding protein